MKLMKYIAAASIGLMTLAACTDLDETLYDQVGTQNYYNTKNDVIRAVFRPFDMRSGASRAAMCSTSCRPTS